MTYKHLTTRELTFIYNFWKQDIKAYHAAKALKRSSETVYRVYRFLDAGNSISQFQENYRVNKTHCGRKAIELPEDETKYIKQKLALGWTPDTIIGRAEIQISCSMRTLYRLFQRGVFNVKLLSMKGKRHPNGYVERRGKAGRLGRSIYQRYQDYPHFQHEFGHLEADTVQGKAHQGAVMTLVERLSKVEIILNIQQKSAECVNKHLNQWLSQQPKHLFKSITFDNGKEFTGWKEIANKHDISTYFAEVGAPNQRGLNENNNGLIRRDGLNKSMDFRNLPNALVQQVSSRRNHIPKKSLNYKTPIEVFMENITDKQLCYF
ncbi:IS30 family transposase [Ligilactobacillus acidipiscis]|uniref:Mobile element protein n=1 Tax=Ligilactobacillus acidipiscis TaxID=89059 RepID=A0A1K1KLD2_9LACO|nr:IS30 family transposase [Ligilactobacillus acidipiscis]SFV39685.1 Mobile element protein [Ligilactobacillus acidipiscis]